MSRLRVLPPVRTGEDDPLTNALMWAGDARMCHHLTPWYRLRERRYWRRQARTWERRAVAIVTSA